jgi:hypothetical protein
VRFFYFILLAVFPTQLIFAQEKRIKIAVIDTGIVFNEQTKPYLCNGDHYDLTGTGLEDTQEHGTNVAGIIAEKINPKTHCLLIIKFHHPGQNTFSQSLQGFKIAIKENVKYINYSSSGPVESKRSRDKERSIIQTALDRKIYVVTSAGNDDMELSSRACVIFPACYQFNSPFFRVVGNGWSNETRHESSNYGTMVTDWRRGVRIKGLFGVKATGTSQSAAILTSELAGKK